MELPADIERLLHRASALMRSGDIAAAIPAYETLLAAWPDLPASWYNLGWLRRRARRPEAALDAYARALDLGIDGPAEVHLERALVLVEQLGRSEEARAELEYALALEPDYLPALLNLGNLHEDHGARDEARGAYERVLAIDPANALALTRLAGIARPRDPADPLIARLRAMIADPRMAAEDRSLLGFALGQALDSAGAHDEAFAAYVAANRASALPPYDRAGHEAFVDRLIAAFPLAVPPSGSSDAPLFVCGMFRSGSALAEHMLGRHPAVVPAGELDTLPTLIETMLAPYPESIAGAPDRLAAVREAYLAEVGQRYSGDGLVIDKRPDNFLHIGLIKTLFPDARFVHTRRDPIDNCLSIFFLHLDAGMAHAGDLGDIAHWYGQYRRLMAHWRALYPNDIFDLDYDALVADPKPVAAALLRFCGLAWDEAVLAAQDSESAIRTASVWQVRQPLYRGSSGRWRHYERHLGALRAALGSGAA